MSKTIEENKLAVTIKIFLWEFNLYCKFMCTDKNNDKDKTNLLPLPFQFVYTVLNCWKTTKSMTLKLSDFQFAFINRKCMIGLFCIANLLEVVKKNKYVFNFLTFNPG